MEESQKTPAVAKKEKVSITGLKKTTKVPDLTSIKENLIKQETVKEDDQPDIDDLKVSVERLKKTWDRFAEKLKDEGREREYNTLNQNVEFGEDLCIKLTLPNSFQSLTIEALQQELLTYLRTQLKNRHIQLSTEIEKVEGKKMIYTNSEKFEFLAGKYPNLKKLKKRLDLDTDF